MVTILILLDILKEKKITWMEYIPLFNSLIHFYELRELNMNGGMFTWSNNQDAPTLVKLDRILVTKE